MLVFVSAVVSDALEGSFWTRHALLTSLVGSVIVVMLSVAVINEVIERRRRRRWSVLAQYVMFELVRNARTIWSGVLDVAGLTVVDGRRRESVEESRRAAQVYSSTDRGSSRRYTDDLKSRRTCMTLTLGKVVFRLCCRPHSPVVRLRPPSFHPVRWVRPCSRVALLSPGRTPTRRRSGSGRHRQSTSLLGVIGLWHPTCPTSAFQVLGEPPRGRMISRGRRPCVTSSKGPELELDKPRRGRQWDTPRSEQIDAHHRHERTVHTHRTSGSGSFNRGSCMNSIEITSL